MNGEKFARCSSPKDGTFSAIVGDIPRDHARAFCMASNEEERWQWQFPDLNEGDEISFKIIKTDWCDEPDTIE